MKPLRIGLVGLHDHYHAIPFADEIQKSIEGIELVAVADEQEWLVKDWAEKRGLDWTTDPMALIARTDIDAVILTSSAAAYIDQVEAAAALGKHVLLDKPISTTLADADRVVSASRKVKVLVAYLLRFVPSYVEARDAMQKGAIGRLTSGFYSIRVPSQTPGAEGIDWSFGPIKARGHGLLDHGVHFTDFFRWFSGSEPASVVATIGSPFCPEASPDDYGIATYTLANGATVTLESTRQSDTRDSFAPLSNPDRATVAGTKGEMEFHYQRSPQIEVNGTEEPWRRRRYADHVGQERYEDAYRNLLVEFRDIIAQNREPSPSAADGRAALEMMLAAYEAANTGSRVSFPYVGDRIERGEPNSNESGRAAAVS